MNESENYLDQLLNAVDGRSDLNDSDPVNPEEIESKEQMPQKSTRETIDIPDSNDLFMDQFEQELRKDNDPDEFLKQFEQELDRDESSQGVTKATQPMLDDIDQIMESVNQEAANDTAEMAASAVEKTAEQKEDTAEVKNDEDASEDGIDDLAIDDIGIDDFGLDDPETENEKAVSDEDDELMKILSGTGEDSEIPEADNAKAEVQPDDEVKEEKKPKKPKVKQPPKPGDIIRFKPKSIIVFVMLIVGIVVLVQMFGYTINYSGNINLAKDYYANQEYDKAYNSLDGIKLSGDDETLYKQAKVVMYVQRQYESYENYEKMNMHTEALNALVKGVDRYQTYRSEAKELGVEDKMTEVYNLIIKAFKDKFKMSETEAISLVELSKLDFTSYYYKIEAYGEAIK